jgi:hypothetical protein
MSKHPFIDGYYIYTQIACIVVGVFCLHAHLFWQGGAAIAGAGLLFFLGRWMDAKLKGIQSAETISLREAMKDEEE